MTGSGTMMEGFKFRAMRIPIWDGEGVYIFYINREKRQSAQPITIETVDAPEPFLSMDNHDAQSLMDQLWDCGYRPTEGTGSAGALAAVEKHLKDMREIAFNTLGMKEKVP